MAVSGGAFWHIPMSTNPFPLAPPPLTGNVTIPPEPVTAQILRPVESRTKDSPAFGGARRKPSQSRKASWTQLGLNGRSAKSRVITTKLESPAGHANRRGDAKELTGSGQPAW